MSLSATGLRKTITLTAENGDVSVFSTMAFRGNGRGSGSYVFEPISGRRSLLTVSGNYGIDLTMFDVSGGGALADVILADGKLTPRAIVSQVTLDWACGTDENDFD